MIKKNEKKIFSRRHQENKSLRYTRSHGYAKPQEEAKAADFILRCSNWTSGQTARDE